ncbi:MAG: twin-arginine translocase subunit TatC, partial [Planctomycetes bacterium]|nr:twin-arginine translocase subunit TatC [Planctomycetota bacterium]
LALGVLFIVAWGGFVRQLEALFMLPHRRAAEALSHYEPPIAIDLKLQVLGPVEHVFFDLKVAFLAAMLFGFPYLLWQIWSFIAAGLFPKERKVVLGYLPFSVLAGLTGIAFGYTIMIPKVLEFLYSMVNTDLLQPAYRLTDYFSIFLMFTFALALVFQLPLLLMGLGAAGLVDAAKLRKYRRHFILVAFVLGALLTPPDPMSQAMMAAPTIILYEVGILLVAMQALGKKKTSPDPSSGGDAPSSGTGLSE